MKAYIRVLLLLCFAISTAWAVGEREVTMTSYFPVPYAAYNSIDVKNNLQMGLSPDSRVVINADSSTPGQYALSVTNTKVNNGDGKMGNANINFSNMKGLEVVNNGSVVIGGEATGSANASFKNVYVNGMDNFSTSAKMNLEMPVLRADGKFTLYGKELPDCKVNGLYGVYTWKQYTDPNQVTRWVLACEKNNASTETQTRACTLADVGVTTDGSKGVSSGDIQKGKAVSSGSISKSGQIIGFKGGFVVGACGTKTRECVVGTEECTEWTGRCQAIRGQYTESIDATCKEAGETVYTQTDGSVKKNTTMKQVCVGDGGAVQLTQIGNSWYTGTENCYRNVTENVSCSVLGSEYTGNTTRTYKEYKSGNTSTPYVNPNPCTKCTSSGYQWEPGQCTATNFQSTVLQPEDGTHITSLACSGTCTYADQLKDYRWYEGPEGKSCRCYCRAKKDCNGSGSNTGTVGSGSDKDHQFVDNYVDTLKENGVHINETVDHFQTEANLGLDKGSGKPSYKDMAM